MFVTARVNAAVFYDLSFRNLLFPTRKNLEIGLGLVEGLTLDELKAVIAHEFGHFAQRTMAVGRWVYVSHQIAGHVIVHRGWIDNLLRGLSYTDIRIAWIGWILRLLVWSIRAVFDTGRLPDGTAYLVMELLEGVSLDAHLRAWGSLSIGESVDILAQVLSGLDAAHENRIVHRDIKPGNIFLCGASPTPHVKILDFGFAKALDSSAMLRTRKSVRLGTRGYMSPEQLMGDRIDGRSDVFATGLVLYELLA